MIALLPAGADPHELPEEMWEDYLKSYFAYWLTNVTVLSDYTVFSDSAPLETQDALCRKMNLLQRYLWKATKFPGPYPRRKRLVEMTATTALSIILYHIKGQHSGTHSVIEPNTCRFPFQKSKPHCPAGSSGHGKTELAKRMGGLLSLQSMLVDCTEVWVCVCVCVCVFPIRRGLASSSRSSHWAAQAMSSWIAQKWSTRHIWTERRRTCTRGIKTAAPGTTTKRVCWPEKCYIS